MNKQPTLRRQDQPIEIGPRHGYRIEGDHAFINADLQIPPHHSGGEWTLELWATEEPYREGPLTGVKVAQIALDLPTPIGPYLHQVDSWADARLPLQGRAHAMVLALSSRSGRDRPACTLSQTTRSRRLHRAALRGRELATRSWETRSCWRPTRSRTRESEGNLSGTLSLELWAFPVAGASSTEGLRLAASSVERVAGQSYLSGIETRVAFNEPPAGRYRLALLLSEWTLAHDLVARDRRDFGADLRAFGARGPRCVPGAAGRQAAAGARRRGRGGCARGRTGRRQARGGSACGRPGRRQARGACARGRTGRCEARGGSACGRPGRRQARGGCARGRTGRCQARGGRGAGRPSAGLESMPLPSRSWRVSRGSTSRSPRRSSKPGPLRRWTIGSGARPGYEDRRPAQGSGEAVGGSLRR